MSTPAEVLAFWFQGKRDEWRKVWFMVDPAFDDAIRQRFGTVPEQALAGTLSGWATTAEGALALCLVLDQFPRNLHRGSARAFACDALARQAARDAVLARGLDRGLTPTERCFLYLPFEHSEDMADQDLSVALFEGLRDSPTHRAPDGAIDYAWRHRAVVRLFSRFPHRNEVLGRTTTPAEAAWLARNPKGF